MTEARIHILEQIKRKDRVSIQYLADQLNMARSTVKEHLGLMEREGWVAVEKVKQDAGRPVMMYSLTESGNRFFPNAQGRMLSSALRYIKKNMGEDGLYDFIRKFWSSRLEEAKRRLAVYDADDYEGRREELYRILEEQKFMPEIEWVDQKNKEDADTNISAADNDDDEASFQELRIRECNCPFPEAVKETRLPCELEAQFFRQLLDGELKRTTYIPDGYSACTYHIKVNR